MAGVKEQGMGRKLAHAGLRAEGLSKKYKKFWLKDVFLDIPPGTILGLLGRNGAGKTTTIKLLAGQAKKSGGKVWVNGVDMDKEPVLARSQIGFVMDGPMFLEGRSLWGNGMAFGRFYPGFTEAGWKKWLSVFGLQKSVKLRELSKGERVKFQFAFAIAHHPRLLLLDEPTGNLDPVFRKEFLDILLDVAEEERISVLFSSHLTEDLEKAADKIALLEQGKLLYMDSMGHLLNRYCLVKGGAEEGRRLNGGGYPEIVGIQVTKVGFEALVDREKLQFPQGTASSSGLPAHIGQPLGLEDGQASASYRNWPAILGSHLGLKDGFLCEEIDLSKWMYYMTKGGRQYGQDGNGMQ